MNLWTMLLFSEVQYCDLIPYYPEDMIKENGELCMTKRAYWFPLWGIVGRCIIVSTFYLVVDKYKWVVTAFLILCLLDIPDYMLRFGEYLFYLGSETKIPIEYGLLKGISMVLIMGKVIINELCFAKR